MPSILERFRRPPSVSSADSPGSSPTATTDSSHARHVAFPDRDSDEYTITQTHPRPTVPRAPVRIPSGSHFVEDVTTPPKTLDIPHSPLVLTPKLVLTEEGNSPRSFGSSPQLHSPSKARGLGYSPETVS
jgi:hypothetical protein